MSSGIGDGANMRPLSSFQPASRLSREPSVSRANSAASSAADASTRGGSGGTSGVAQPRPRPLIRGAVGSGSTILVNSCQRGNPVLQHIRNVGWEYGDIVPDYQVGVASCMLFLSLRYHRLHPEYIHSRIQKLQQMYTLRILLVMCDVNDHQPAIKELTKVSIINNLTMIVAWSAEEAGSYIETYKSFEHKPPDLIKERINNDYMSQLTAVLTSVRGINKTDVLTLISTFGSLDNIARATVEELSMCPGFGEIKAKRLRDVFRQPFRVGETRTHAERRQAQDANSTSSTTAGGPSRQLPQEAPSAEVGDTTAAESDGDAQIPAASGPSRAIEAIENELEGMSEEEQMRLAMEMSMGNSDDF